MIEVFWELNSFRCIKHLHLKSSFCCNLEKVLQTTTKFNFFRKTKSENAQQNDKTVQTCFNSPGKKKNDKQIFRTFTHQQWWLLIFLHYHGARFFFFLLLPFFTSHERNVKLIRFCLFFYLKGNRKKLTYSDSLLYVIKDLNDSTWGSSRIYSGFVLQIVSRSKLAFMSDVIKNSLN